MRAAAVWTAALLVGAACLVAGERPRGELPRLRGIRKIVERRPKSVDWGSANNLLTFGRWRTDGYCDVFTSRPEGTGLRCLTAKDRLCPQRHNGNPTWHPSGELIVFTAQNQDAGRGEDTVEARSASHCRPGRGLNCNLWAVRSDGSRAWQLTRLATSYKNPEAVIHPQFSHDGRKLVWAQQLGRWPKDLVWGEWALMVADFIVKRGVPRLENVRRLQPGRKHNFYEAHAFSPDDSAIMFAANCEPGQEVTGMDIYTCDLKSGKLRNLTNTLRDWDEHAHWSPDGRWIAWMSSTDIEIEYKEIRGGGWAKYLTSDLWIMDAEGKSRQRLTFFNQDGHPHSTLGRTIVADSAWAPDGRSLMATVAYGAPVGEKPDKATMIEVLLDLPEEP